MHGVHNICNMPLDARAHTHEEKGNFVQHEEWDRERCEGVRYAKEQTRHTQKKNTRDVNALKKRPYIYKQCWHIIKRIVHFEVSQWMVLIDWTVCQKVKVIRFGRNFEFNFFITFSISTSEYRNRRIANRSIEQNQNKMKCKWNTCIINSRIQCFCINDFRYEWDLFILVNLLILSLLSFDTEINYMSVFVSPIT